MKIKFLAYLLSCLVLGFLGCGDDSLYEPSASERLYQFTFVTPSRYTGTPYIQYTPVNKVYLDVDESVKFSAVYAIGNHYIAMDSASHYYLSLQWIVEGEYHNIQTFRVSYNQPGHRQAILQTVDFFEDTLTDTLDIFVNTPLSIKASYPVNGFNQATIESTDGVELGWAISGEDEWEDVTCTLYASSEEKEVWSSPLGNVNCHTPAKFDSTKYSEINSPDIVYWGIKAVSTADEKLFERDSTEIFHFFTTFPDADSAKLVIPFVFDNLQKCSVNTRITLISAMSDTLKTLSNDLCNGDISTNVLPQTGLKILLEEVNQFEYGTKTLEVDIPEKTTVLTDTLHFVDQIKPQIQLLENTISTLDSLRFVILDNGSRINSQKFHVKLDNKLLDYNYHSNKLSIHPKCNGFCHLEIIGEDFAGNTIAPLYWEISAISDTYVVAGPYLEGIKEP